LVQKIGLVTTVFELAAGKGGSYTFSAIAGSSVAAEVLYANGGVYWINCYVPQDSIGYCTSVSLMETINGQTTDLWDFADTYFPAGGMVVNAAGDVFGTVPGDNGQTSYGYVYEWSSTAGFSVLHTFDGVDGSLPNVLRQDAAGDLYGTTAGDGTDNIGTVFKITSKGVFSVLYTFPIGAEGPTGGLTLDSSENIYGTTSGSVFKISSRGVESVIYSGTVGAGLVMDTSGNLYGTTTYGGSKQLGSVF
jgi:uncharacterized repeat protein (TIGR03803 family)